MIEEIFNEINNELEYFKLLDTEKSFSEKEQDDIRTKCSTLYNFFYKILFPNTKFIGNTDPEKFNDYISAFYNPNKLEIHLKKRFEYESLVDVTVYVPTKTGYVGIMIGSADYILYKPLIPHNSEK